MNVILTNLAKKRLRLIEKSTLQREQLESLIDGLRQPLKTVDNSMSLIRFIKLHPLLMLGTTFVLNQMRVRFFGQWLARFKALSNVSRLLKRIFNG